MRRIEWIGVRLPQDDDDVALARISHRYNEWELATLEALAIVLAPRIRQDGSRVRELGPKHVDGLSKTYRWGLDVASYTQSMGDGDADLILGCVNGYEFRDADRDPDRRPVVPPEMWDQTLHNIVRAATSGQRFYSNEVMVLADAEGVLREYERMTGAARERGAERDERAAFEARRR